MNRLGMLSIGTLSVVVLAMAVFTYAGLELAKPSDGTGALSTPDIEVLRHRAYQASNAGANSAPETVDIEVLRHNCYTYLQAAEPDSAKTILPGKRLASEACHTFWQAIFDTGIKQAPQASPICNVSLAIM